MGVRGLTAFMNEYGCFEDVTITNKQLIIDGNNLRFVLLQRRVNTYYGSDYDKYGDAVKAWFDRLIENGNSIILIFDGVAEDIKHKTAVARKKDQIHSAIHVNPSILRRHTPMMGKDVFVKVAKSYPSEKVAVIQTHFECDNVMANLAKKLNAPVMTNDSDFFVFNVDFFPLDSFDPDSLKCSKFDKKAFMKKFSISDESTIYLMASLLGNDYVPRKLFNDFFAQIHFPLKTKRVTPSIKRIMALIHWLARSESTNGAINSLLTVIPKQKKRSSIESLNSLNDIQEFIKDVDETILSPLGDRFPEEFLNLYLLRFLWKKKMEETGLIFCMPIYKKIAEFMTVSVGSPVKCLFRQKGYLGIKFLDIDNPLNLCLNMDMKSKLGILLQVVGFSYSHFQSLMDSFDGQYHVLYLALHYYSNNRNGATPYIRTLMVLLLLKSPLASGEDKVGLDERFTTKMKSYFYDKSKEKVSHFSRFIVHEFSLIQWCIHAISHLNILLGHPITPMIPLHHFWNGTFLYNFTNDILSYRDRDARFNSLLCLRGDDKEQTVLQLMDRMTTRFSKCLARFDSQIGVSNSGRRPRNRKNNKNIEEKDSEISNLVEAISEL
nr:uncharacterized protein LOC121124876 [Lepeophtheirus salmonis]